MFGTSGVQSSRVAQTLTYLGFYDVALHDFGLFVTAVVLARLATPVHGDRRRRLHNAGFGSHGSITSPS
ncbi:MAG: hypothetical protein JO296_11485 [Pseudonocardiales bacterium]|nr:hypothetical protein [Pseudonocardiales bacterium]MBV9650748.1 hypothetical protein [Pseudonocardiales bacterium]